MFSSIYKSLQSVFFRLSRPFVYIFGNKVNSILCDPKHIVITRLEDVGDMLVFIPTLKTFRHGYPNSKITLLTRSKAGFEIIESCPYIDQIFHLKNTFFGKLSLVLKLRKNKPDLFVISSQEFGKVKWGLWGGAKIIVGYQEAKLYNEFRKIKLPGFIQVAPKWNDSLTELERNLQLASAVGITTLHREIDYTWIRKTDTRFSNALVRGLGIKPMEFTVILAPFSKRKPKEWEYGKFAIVADWLIENLKANVVVIGAVHEEPKANLIFKNMKNTCYNAVGRTSLRQLPAFMKNTDFVIGVDSGPIHFAAALKIPYVSIFGPGEFTKWAHTYNSRIQQNIFKNPYCSPCNKEVCDDNHCMTGVGVDEVIDRVKLMAKNGVWGNKIKTRVLELSEYEQKIGVAATF